MYTKKFILFVLMFGFICQDALAAGSYKPGEVIVELKNGTVLSSKFLRSSKTIAASGKSRYMLIKSDESVSQMIKELKGDPDIAKISPNYKREALIIPNDHYFNDQWGLYNTGQTVNGIHKTTGIPGADIDAPNGWDITTGSSNVVVADIDSGIDYNHPDLKNNLWKNPGEIPNNRIDDDGNGYIDDVYGIDTVNNDSDPFDDNGHGTFTAGIIAAEGNNDIGISGVCWHCKIMAVKALDSNGIGYDSTIIEAINYIINMKKKYHINIVAINASLGGYGNDEILKDVIKTAGDAGILFIAAAGNESNDNDINPLYPASYDLPNIISVAASDSSDTLASFSNYGKTTVDVMAPGVNVLSTYYDSSGAGYAFADGTSIAAPFAAGVAALVASKYTAESALEWANRIDSGAKPIAANKVLSGRLDLYGALTSDNSPPVISLLSASDRSGAAPLTVNFSVSASDLDGAIKEYNWDFDDNGIIDKTTSSPSVSHTYNQAGTYTALVRVVDNLGARSYKTINITVAKASSTGSLNQNNTRTSTVGSGSGGGCTIGESNQIGISLLLFLLISIIYPMMKNRFIGKS